MGGPRWLAIALVVLVVGGLAAWGIVEATSSDGDGTRLVDTAQEERVQQRIERLERMLIAIDRADEQPTARQKQRALRRAKARVRVARARADAQREAQSK